MRKFIHIGKPIGEIVYKNKNIVIEKVREGTKKDICYIVGTGYSLSVDDNDLVSQHDPFMDVFSIKTNEEVFWDVFKSHYGIEKMKDKEYLDEFYTNEFRKTKESCEENPLAKDIISFCKDNNLLVVLSTNPIFPKAGTMTRMSYIGLKEEDFDYVTYYENSSYCKPNPMYFKKLLNKFNLKPEEVIVFGNHTYEDGECAKLCGIECFMVGNYVINSPKTNTQFEHVLMEKVIDKIKEYL